MDLSVRIGDVTAKGYVLDEFNDTFKRYIPRSEVEALKAELAMNAAPSPPQASATPNPPPCL